MQITKDMKFLVIVESPNKVHLIKEYLKKAGYRGATVVASLGHIMQLADGGNCYNSGVDPTNAFSLNLQVAADKKEIVKKLTAQAQAAEAVVLMSDGDREGELISWSLIKFLKLPKTKIIRAITHEITPKAVVAAIENPVHLDENLIDAGFARMTIDKLTGYSLSPTARTYVGAKSVGRCQSAGLKLIVDREKEISNFKPEQYYDLYLAFKKNNVDFKAKYVGTEAKQVDHLKTEEEVNFVKYECNKKPYIVKYINKREKHDKPKPPFCTSTFQQEVASKIGLAVKDAMSIAQHLFENGNITYHRSDSTEISPEFLPSLKGYIETNYGKSAYIAPRKGKKQENAQNGHECLRVTDANLTPELFNKQNPNTLHQKVYRIIWQRTVASAMNDAIISETTYSIFNGKHIFNLISNELINEGYKAVYNYKDEDENNADGLIKEIFIANEELNDTNLSDILKQTSPPARFKEATLVKELEKTGIGRPSTYATIVETILSKDRGYCTLDNKFIVPTDKGIQLSNFLDRAFSNIINVGYTREMEASLDKIAAGTLNKLAFLTDFYNTLDSAIKNNTEGAQAASSQLCPKCGAAMIVRRNKWGKLFYGCSTYPSCNGIINIK